MIRRARIFLLVGVAVAVVVLATNLPLGALLRGRATVATESLQLSALRAANRTLAAQVKALSQPATVDQIAHEDYGLILPGQRSVVVLPGPSAAGSNGASGPLATETVPPSDLLASDSILAPPEPAGASAGTHAAAAGGGFWSRVVDKLEFWKSVF